MQTNPSTYGAPSTDPASPDVPAYVGMPQLSNEAPAGAMLDGLSHPLIEPAAAVDPVAATIPAPEPVEAVVNVAIEEPQELHVPSVADVPLTAPAVTPEIIAVPSAPTMGDGALITEAPSAVDVPGTESVEGLQASISEGDRIAELTEAVAPLVQAESVASAAVTIETQSDNHEVDPDAHVEPVAPLTLGAALDGPHREDLSILAERGDEFLGSGVKG